MGREEGKRETRDDGEGGGGVGCVARKIHGFGEWGNLCALLLRYGRALVLCDTNAHCLARTPCRPCDAAVVVVVFGQPQFNYGESVAVHKVRCVRVGRSL